MKKFLGILALYLLCCNALIAEEYPNSWKMDVHCKQGSNDWYESAFVVAVEYNEFTLGPFDRWQNTNYVFKGKISDNKIKINETWKWKNGKSDSLSYSGEFINDNEATIEGTFRSDPNWNCEGKFYKVKLQEF